MKRVILLVAMSVLAFSPALFAADDATTNKGPVYHVVALKFKEGTSPEKIKAVEDAFRELKTKIPMIQSLHWGTNISKEQRNHGFTHAFVLTFNDARDRDAYLKDPAHKAFGEVAGPVLADVFVIDFQARD